MLINFNTNIKIDEKHFNFIFFIKNVKNVKNVKNKKG